MNTHAFTLIELLVVIAILGVLAGLGLAGASTFKESARLSGCQSTLHQMGTGIAAYSNDWQGYLPGFRHLRGSYGSYTRTEALLFDQYMALDGKRYLDNDQPYGKCPAFYQRCNDYFKVKASTLNPTKTDTRRYELNAALTGLGGSTTTSYVKTADLDRTMIVYVCGNADYGYSTGASSDTPDRYPQAPHRPRSTTPWLTSQGRPLWSTGTSAILTISGAVLALKPGNVTGAPALPTGLDLPGIIANPGVHADYDETKYLPLANGSGGGKPNGLGTGTPPGLPKFLRLWYGRGS